MSGKLNQYSLVLGAALGAAGCSEHVLIGEGASIAADAAGTDAEISDAGMDVQDAVNDVLADANTDAGNPCDLLKGESPEGITLSSNPYNPTLIPDAGDPNEVNLKITLTTLADSYVSTDVRSGNTIVRNLEQDKYLQPGTLETYFDGRDENGNLLPPGNNYLVFAKAKNNNGCVDTAFQNLEIKY